MSYPTNGTSHDLRDSRHKHGKQLHYGCGQSPSGPPLPFYGTFLDLRERARVSFIIIGTSQTFINSSSIESLALQCPFHVISDIVPNSGRIIQPLTLRLGCNTDTPMALDIVLEKLISKKVARNTRLITLALTVTHTCATG